MRHRIVIALGALLWLTTGTGCATDSGHAHDCPDCDNATELLVGDKCVPIDQVAACGPDGHAHGDECHCYSGQAPTDIGGTEYCLQADCAHGHEVDYDARACTEGSAAGEPVTAVASVDDVDSAHADMGKPVAVTLPADTESYVHFEATETGEYAIYLDADGVFGAALDEGGSELAAHDMGANADCAVEFPAVWHAEVPATGEVVIRFAAGSVDTVKIIIYHIEEDGHEH